MVEMHLAAVRVDLHTNTPMVFLREVGGARRTLPILIAVPEATAIELALRGVEPPRPLTHDLMRDVFAAIGVRVERVVVTELRVNTFYAEIHLSQDGRHFTVSSRPSDAIALAARVNAPIFADDELLDAEGVELEESVDGDDLDESDDEDVTPDELVEQFKEFIDEIRPEDFSS